jgi:hypothetical protein
MSCRLPAIVEEPARSLRLVAFTITVLLLQIANDREDRAVRDWSTTAATKRFGDAGSHTAEACVRGAAGGGTEAACRPGFGRFETLFDGCELCFEAGGGLARVEESRGGVRTDDSLLSASPASLGGGFLETVSARCGP